MKRDQFLRRLGKHCRKHDLRFGWVPHKGKGSHGTVYVGSRKSTLPDDDLPRYYIDDILEALGLPKDSV